MTMTMTMILSKRRLTWLSLLFSLIVATCLSCRVCGFAPSRQHALLQQRWNHRRTSRNTATLHMALTPVGPFCPFRSSAAQEMEPRMDSLHSQTPDAAMDLARIQLDMQTGNMPDPDRLRKVATYMDAAVTEWETLMTRLVLSSDFQMKEYAKFVQAFLETHGVDANIFAKTMKWQSGCFMAMANDTPPPMPPPELDLMKLMQEEQPNDESSPKPFSISSMVAAEKITVTAYPFTGEEEAFESSPIIREEYETLCHDHSTLIELGVSYANFDPSGKIAYIDQMETIQDRWDVFFARFQLLGKMNTTFTRQCIDFLARMGMDEEQYKKLLKRAHDIMRQDAERERNMSVRFW